ncbi:YbaY family lipoprotein [Thalassospira lucentensis]|uniref:YbaY family lipoprotein n=1 Tax=Thalassospira lucentensis TaxID=168935 RepID=UPI003AA7B3F4
MTRFSSLWGSVRTICAIGMVMLMAGCAILQSNTTKVTGTVTYRERIALAPDSNDLVLRILDVSRADAPATVIASLTTQVASPPMSFTLPYDPAKIEANHTYVIEASIINQNGDRVFRSDQAYPVITKNAPSNVDILVKPVARPMSDGARKSDGSDVSRDVAAIERRLGDLRMIPGQYRDGDNKVKYKAYVTTDDEPVFVKEHRDLGDYGKADVKFYYRNGKLLRFVEQAERTNFGGTSPQNVLRYRVELDFAMGRFSEGSKTVNGQPSEADEHEISAALAQSKVALSRIDAKLSENSAMPLAGPQVFVCEDKGRFSVRFDAQADTAVVEFLGREPMVLKQKRTASGYQYANDQYDLRGKGQEATLKTPMGPTRCAVSADPISLALAPGDFPLVTTGDLKAANGDVWTRDFDDIWPAITVCLAENTGDFTSVLKAAPTDHGMVKVRTINGTGGRYDCLAPTDGMGTAHTEMVEATTNILPGENTVRFTPANGAYPTGECFKHERLEKDGVFIGWLSHNRCTS